MIFGNHQCAYTCSDIIIPRQCSSDINVLCIGETVFELYDADNTIIHNSYKLWQNALAYFRMSFDLK